MVSVSNESLQGLVYVNIVSQLFSDYKVRLKIIIVLEIVPKLSIALILVPL